MEFILNGQKYSIINHELFIDYLLLDSYFRQKHSLYDYDIEFEFINPLLEKDKVTFEDIQKGSELLEELIENGKVNFIKSDFIISHYPNGNFKISYQNLVFEDIAPGEAIPLLIALYTLLDYKPAISLSQIEEELDNFIVQFRKYDKN